MLKEFEVDENQQVVVLADCYYACIQIMNYCREKLYSFVSVLKSNRVFLTNNRKTTVRKFAKRNFRTKKNKVAIRIKENNYRTITRKISLKTGGAVKVVFSKHQSHRTVLAVFTTNPAAAGVFRLKGYWNSIKTDGILKYSLR